VRYYVIIKTNKNSYDPNKVKIWECFDKTYIWGSVAYEVIDYANTYKEAQAIARKARWTTKELIQ
tara:strand:+ start:77 stop:271 length:195 start_codon:yes stop_codon:yes gene_type:complete